MRGTVFLVEVNTEGLTTVEVTEGTVSVGAQGEEVAVPAGYEASVDSGAAPSQPTWSVLQGQGDDGPPGLTEDEGLPPGLDKDEDLPPGLTKDEDLPPGLDKDKDVPPGQDKDKDVPPGQDKDKDKDTDDDDDDD